MADRLRLVLQSRLFRWSALAVLVFVIITAGVLRPKERAAAPAPSQPTTVVLVTVDTLRADIVSYAGRHAGTTPFLDHLAAGGVTFTAAYSTSSWTAPAMASLFTGLYPTSHGVLLPALRKRKAVHQFGLPDSLLTLAESLKKAGWVTIGVPSNRNLAERLGFGAGFDFYYGEADYIPGQSVNQQAYALLERAFGPDWNSEWKKHRTFLWLHYFDPHDPYFAHEPWISRYAPDFEDHPKDFPQDVVMRTLRQQYPHPGPAIAARLEPLYASEVSYFDAQFSYLAHLLGLEDPNVLLIVTADHGEEFIDHGGLGHAHTLYEELVHIPLIFNWPGHLPAGRRADAHVSLVDIFPTLAALLALDTPADLPGEPIIPLHDGQTVKEPRLLYMEVHRRQNPAKAIREGDWKLIRYERPGRSTQLFNLARDPGERDDVAADDRAAFLRLQQALERQVAQLPGPPSDQKTQLVNDERVEEELRALGYIQ